AHSALRVPEPVQDRPCAGQSQLHPEVAEAGYVGERLVVSQGLRSCSARSVLRTSMARVIGPTPPGEGLSQRATSLTSAATSPTWRPSTRLTPTSITAAPGLIIAAVTVSGLPTATTRMSASRVTS